MASLMDIPGLGPYMGARQQVLGENAQRQQQAIGLMQLMGQMDDRAAKQSMAPLQRRLLEAQAADAEQKPDDRVIARENTKQIALSRMAQTAGQIENTHQWRMAQAKTQQDRDTALAIYRQERLAHDVEYRALTGARADARLFYDTGMRPGGGVPAAPQPSAPPVPQPQGGLMGVLAGRPQAEQDAIRAVSEAGSNPLTVSVPAPQQAPVQTTGLAAMIPQAPVTRASSFGAEGRFPPVGGAQSEPMQIPLSAVTEQPQAAPAPVSPSVPAPQMPQFVGSPRERAAAENKWRLEQSKTSIAGAGNFSPAALKFTAQQYLAGDVQAAQGFARSATARIALQEAIVQEAMAQGLSPAQVAAKKAEFAGVMSGSRTVGTRAANISLAATEAQEMIPIVKETSDKFSRTNFVPWNRVLEMWEKNTGGPEVAEFGAALNSLVNVYARAIAPSGVPTVSDKDHAREMLNRVQSPAQVAGVLGIMNRELEIAKKAPGTVREAMRQGVTGETAPQRRATDNAPPPVNTKGWKLHTDAKGNKAYVGPNNEIEEVRR